MIKIPLSQPDILDLSLIPDCTQQKRLEEIIRLRTQVADWYREELRDEPLVVLPTRFPNSDPEISRFVYVIRFCSPALCQIVAEHLTVLGIETRPYFPAFEFPPDFSRPKFQEKILAGTETRATYYLALPFFTKMSREEVTTVCTAVKDILDLYRQ